MGGSSLKSRKTAALASFASGPFDIFKLQISTNTSPLLSLRASLITSAVGLDAFAALGATPVRQNDGRSALTIVSS